ncbi:MAG: 5-(carboxyamino)imidazole ribonucleotide synthase [Actinobacteria bacterium]|nr:5-(carboxyamino)imidazole ribonucleotide synthase [Actinomycetota bacterium]
MESPLVAVLGGGQLGRMLGLAAIPLGVRCRFLDPVDGAPAAAVGPLVVGPLGDPGALDAVAAGADVVTYEWEGVPAEGAARLAAGCPVRPGPDALAVAQDRLAEKTAFRRLGIGVPEFAAVDDRAGLEAAIDAVGAPAILKTRRGGYDGKGQFVLQSAADADAAFAALGGEPLILEAMVPFDRELSVIAARGLDGEVRCFPLVDNAHRDGILRVSRAPAPGLHDALQAQGEAIAHRLLDDLDYVGVLTVELFDAAGTLLANEIAPRVHNSGHWTIEGAETSQFEQHLRAVLGWPLGSPAARGHAAMCNAIGALPPRDAVLAVAGARLHDYGKAPRPGRKVGHVTVVADSPDALDERLARLLTIAPGTLG